MTYEAPAMSYQTNASPLSYSAPGAYSAPVTHAAPTSNYYGSSVTAAPTFSSVSVAPATSYLSNMFSAATVGSSVSVAPSTSYYSNMFSSAPVGSSVSIAPAASYPMVAPTSRFMSSSMSIPPATSYHAAAPVYVPTPAFQAPVSYSIPAIPAGMTLSREPAISVGAAVNAMFKDGKWYEARVEAANQDGTYRVVFGDGERWTASRGGIELIEATAMSRQPITAGSLVNAKFKDGKHYEGRIEGTNPDGSYQVIFTDGDRCTVAPSDIELLAVASANPRVTPPAAHPEAKPMPQVKMVPKRKVCGCCF